MNIRENRNDTADIGNLQHNRSYAVTSVLAPPEGKWGVDLSYNYDDIFSQTNICSQVWRRFLKAVVERSDAAPTPAQSQTETAAKSMDARDKHSHNSRDLILRGTRIRSSRPGLDHQREDLDPFVMLSTEP